MTTFRITRRRLLVGATGATVVAGASGLWLGVQKISNERFHKAVDRGDAFAPSVYLAVQPDGEVVIWLTRSEMGQGVSTALPMLIADEMDADWSRVRVEQAVAGDGFDYGQMFTAASSSVSGNWIELRRAGATAREMLISAAADQWGVSASDCVADAGFVLHPGSSRRLDFGSLAAPAADKWPSIRPRLKTPAEFRLIGQAVPRIDTGDKVTGKAFYGADVRLDGMRRAVIARSPVFGGSPRQFEDAAARQVQGVEGVVSVTNGVAVVATDTYSAIQGRRALQVEWQAPPEHRVSGDQIAGQLRQMLDEPGGVVRDDGGTPSEVVREITADYQLPFLAHACMEPMNCTASVTPDGCTIWVGSQAPEGARALASAITGLPLNKVVVHRPQLGGGFGRRAAQDFVRDAVEVAMAVGHPVQVLWSREDDLANGEYREATAHRLRVGIDSGGRLRSWHHRIACTVGLDHSPGQISPLAGMGAADQPYDLGAVRVEWSGFPQPLPLRIWRSVGHSYNAFAMESFLDEIAAALDRDPLEMRLELLPQSPRLRHCLEAVAAAARWGSAVEEGRFLGVAATHCMGSYVATIAEVEPVSQRLPRVTGLWCAADCGVVVNPDIARAQVEGGMLYGLDAVLNGGIVLQSGRVVHTNFDRHRVMRISDAPTMEVVLISGGTAPSGVGEIGVPCVAPAVANAWYQATGKRTRDLWGSALVG